MNVGVIGLGLIGGSFARALSAVENVTVYGGDKSESAVLQAKLTGAAEHTLTCENVGLCDYVFIALYPGAVKSILKELAPHIKKGAVVIDTAGTKRTVCEECFKIAQDNGFCFVGGHPMAGTTNSGYKYSRANLFLGASMIVVPKKDESPEVLQGLKSLLVSIGFKHMTVTTAAEHDRIIAYTSQLAHLVSSAYVKSPSARLHRGFSAGSYKDMTRVAKLNPKMWTELFMENRDNLINETDNIIAELTKYSTALKNNDERTLQKLLEEGTMIKESID